MSQQNFVLILKGIAVGIANIIPGVSGGTIALVAKIYTPLLGSIKRINIKSLKLLLQCKFKEFNKYVNFNFLLYCGIGILLGVIVYSSIIEKLLLLSISEDMLKQLQAGEIKIKDIPPPRQLTGFFFGLILASILYISNRIKKINIINYIIALIGVLFAFILYLFYVKITPETGDYSNYLYIFICGIIGVCGMILPGLSGSVILLILNIYYVITNSVVKTKNFILGSGDFNPKEDMESVYTLLIFLTGTVTGLLLFSNIVYWFYNKYTNSTLSMLTGFIVGSLLIIWPWVNEDNKLLTGDEKTIYIPTEFSLENIGILLCIIAGILSIYLLEKITVKK